MSGNFAIKGGGIGPLMANAILNFHFDFLTTSLIQNIAKPPFMRIFCGFDLRALSGKFLRQKSCYPESFRFLRLWLQCIESQTWRSMRPSIQALSGSRWFSKAFSIAPSVSLYLALIRSQGLCWRWCTGMTPASKMWLNHCMLYIV